MMRQLTLLYSETGGAGDASTSRHLASTTTNGESKMNVAQLPRRVPRYDECPTCGAAGWEGRIAGRYTAICGSFWSVSGMEYTAPQCAMAVAS